MSKNSIAAIAVSLALVVLSGCASHAVRPDAPTPTSAQTFVDERMDQAVVSIDKSLKTLLLISRGGEAPRKPTAISDTVAGGDAHGASISRKPISVPSTPQGQRAIDAARESGRKALASRTRIDWKGDPRDLLRALSSKVGYAFFERGRAGPSTAFNIEIHRENASITDVLSDVARALDGEADIVVRTDARTIELVYR